MTRVWAIAMLSVRAAVRSKVVLSLLAALLLTVIALPLTVQGDGTIGGELQVLLTYTLGIVSFILAVVTLWAGCAAVSLEVAAKHIHLVVTKPVSRIEIWLGKWIGLLVLNAALLTVAGGAVYGMIQWNFRPGQVSAEEQQTLHEEILTARRMVRPNLPDVSAEVDRLIQEARESPDFPAQISRQELAREFRIQLLTRAYSTPSGGTLEWTFQLPEGTRTDTPMHLRYKLSTSEFGAEPTLGTWRVRSAGGAEAVQVSQPDAPDAFHTLRLPEQTVGPDRTLTVRYRNDHPRPVTVLFGPDEGLVLFVPVGSFLGNLVRALLIQYAQIAFLAAIGVTAGSLFSMPVASFVALFTLVVIQFLPYIDRMADRTLFVNPGAGPMAPTPTLFDVLLGLLFRAMNAVMAPLQTPSALEPLGIGQLVPWGLVAVTLAVKVLLYGGALALLGSWLFNRRELALPS